MRGRSGVRSEKKMKITMQKNGDERGTTKSRRKRKQRKKGWDNDDK